MQPETDFLVTMDDCLKAGYCARGVRRWFGNQGLDFRAFMKAGIAASELLATGDAYANQVVERSMRRRFVGLDLSGITITLDDARSANKCKDGMQSFADRAGLDFREFARNGIPAADLVATGDPEAIEVVRKAMSARHG